MLLACGSCAAICAGHQHGPWLRVILGPLWQRKLSLNREEKQRHVHTHTQDCCYNQCRFQFLALLLRWCWPPAPNLNHCISAGDHPCVQANTKPGSGAGPAQTTVTQGYITFLLSWLRSVNIDSWTHLLYITSLFWFYSDVLTGLTSHFGTRSFVSRRFFPASLILDVLDTEGCSRKCRNSSYIEQKERKRDPWNKKGKQHLRNYIAFMPKIQWQPLAGHIHHQTHLQWFQQ